MLRLVERLRPPVAPTLLWIGALWAAVLWAALGPPAAHDAAGQPPATVVQEIAAAGQSAPVAGRFDRFDIGGLAIPAPSNRAGNVAFFASLNRGAAAEGLFMASGGDISKIAGGGDATPGGEHIADFTDRAGLSLNGGGAVAFVAALTGGKATSGVFVAVGGTLDPVALSGAEAPDITDGTLISFERPVLNDAGDIAFLASVRRGRDSADAIFLRHGGRLRKLIAAGDAAPGGGVFSGFGTPTMNNRGVVAFPAIIDQGPMLGGIYAIAEGRAHLALAAGSAAPGGGIFAKFSEQVAIDDSGAIAFSALLRQGNRSAAVFTLDGDVATPVAAVGDPAPGGGTFAAFVSWPAVNPSGTIGFVASIDDGPSPLAIYAAGSAGVVRRVGIGDPLPDGGRLASFARYPAIAIGPDDAITFAAASEHDGTRREVLFYDGPPRQGRR